MDFEICCNFYMRILYLITKSEVGGAQTHVVQLCSYFKEKGNEVAVMSLSGGWLEDEAKKIGVLFFDNPYFSNSFSPFRAWKAVSEVKKSVIEFNPDIIHCHSSGAAVFGRLAVRGRIPTLYTAHGWGFNIGVSWFQKYFAVLIEKILSGYAQKIICVSKFVRDLALRYKIAPEKKLVVIYNGVAQIVQFVHNENEKIKIIFVGRLAEPKDPMFLLKAFVGLSQELKNKSEILIIGDGPQKQELGSFIKKNRLTSVGLFGGLPRQTVLENLLVSDIFVLISKFEGLPITILEAMSTGLPVIATDVGGISEAVDSSCGFLIKRGDIAGLQLALTKLITDKDLRKTMGKNAQSIVNSKFSLNKMLVETEKIYYEVTGKTI